MDRLKGKVALVVGAGSIGPGWGNDKATAISVTRSRNELLVGQRSERHLPRASFALAELTSTGPRQVANISLHGSFTARRRSSRSGRSL
jgi:hypothetical protein